MAYPVCATGNVVGVFSLLYLFLLFCIASISWQRYCEPDKYDEYCSASGMFVENRTDGLDARVRKLVYGFRERLDISDNFLIETVI